jgi:hypothetical protein
LQLDGFCARVSFGKNETNFVPAFHDCDGHSMPHDRHQALRRSG